MIRRLLCACVGALLVGALVVPNRAAAKPPDLPEDGTFTAAPDKSPSAPVLEVLPMPQENTDVTCPYLRQQRIDRHACQLADPQIGRDVLDNLKRLEEADNLLDLAKELAYDGFLDAAMACCDYAVELCPGSPCAARASDTMLELALGVLPPARDSEEAAEIQPDEPAGEEPDPGIEPMVCGLMKACHLLMNQGMQHQAAELARQAFALDPQRVQADPLIYKMHLLAESPPAKRTGASEESEPQTCPYCPSAGKPIREIIPAKKKKAADDTSLLMPHLIESMPFEIAANAEGELRVNADCPLGGNVYHLRYTHGSLSLWKTADDGQTKR